MDEVGFSDFLKKKGKSEKALHRYLDKVSELERYLKTHGKSILDANIDDLRGYLFSSKNAQVGFLGIAEYYQFLGNETLQLTAAEVWSEVGFARFKLKDFVDVDLDAVRILKEKGIETAQDMVEAGRTPGMRAALAERTGIPEDEILELVKLSDQARIGGHKGIRARLYHEAGFDTLDKMAAVEPDELRSRTADYIAASGFIGTPPTPGEAADSVAMARHLPRIVEY